MKGLAFLLLVLAGCASNPGIVPTGSETYRLARSAYGLGASQNDAMSAIVKEAGDFCSGRAKTIDIIRSDSRPGWPGHFPEAELEFRCK